MGKMAVNAWKLLDWLLDWLQPGNGCKWLELAVNGWKWMDMTEKG